MGASFSLRDRQSAPMDIAHFAPGFYSSPGLVFYVFPEIIFFFRKFSFPCFPLGLFLWKSHMRTSNSLFRLRSETQITMAAGQNIPELGGYDFEFTSVVPDDFECPVCQLTMKDPIQIGGCGHRLCKICLESLLR